MKIENLKTNHQINPIGIGGDSLVLTWLVAETSALPEEAKLVIYADNSSENIVFSTPVEVLSQQKSVDINLEPRKRYYWCLTDKVRQPLSEIAYFETGKMSEEWEGSWICTEEESEQMPVFIKRFDITKKVSHARLYIYGLGLFEAYINSQKVGDEYLMPGYHSYDLLEQYRTFDITPSLRKNNNTIEVLLGNGWYKGRFGFDGVYNNIYGDKLMFIMEARITYEDGSGDIIKSDDTWQAMQSNILQNNIYDGEILDDTLECGSLKAAVYDKTTELLRPSINAPLKKVEAIEPEIRKHEDGYLLLDFGKIISGWVEFEGEFEYGQSIKISYGELLQDDKFYNDNLRTAKAEFIYTSDGVKKTVRPHFTFFGFRYAKIEGASKNEFTSIIGYQIMSDIKRTGSIKTDNPKVNQLFENTLNSQKSNFVDIPTDCPQRDERMGWTGDAAIFVGTACFHMDCANFFDNYLENLKLEQKLLDGAVPFFVPKPRIAPHEGINPFYVSAGVALWGDVATILPWTLYEYYADKEMLLRHYTIMTSWVDYVTQRVSHNSVKHLWQNDRQLGDWLALDNGDISNPIGKTDPGFIASAYYYYSLSLAQKAAGELKDARYDEFTQLKEDVKRAFIIEYYNKDDELDIELTQTACAIALSFGLYPKDAYEYLKDALRELIEEAGGHLNTGFVGTSLLCKALSENGMIDLAYGLILKEDYPSWLYQVNHGATTVWERWNSILEDGTISGTDMNSMNHYAYGSIAEWAYRYMCGLNPSMHEEVKMTIKPMPHHSFEKAQASWKSLLGEYKSVWEYINGEDVKYSITIPAGANAKVCIGGNEAVYGGGTYTFDAAGSLL